MATQRICDYCGIVVPYLSLRGRRDYLSKHIIYEVKLAGDINDICMRCFCKMLKSTLENCNGAM